MGRILLGAVDLLLIPWAASPSAIAFTSSGCSLQNAAICSKDSDVLSTSQTAVALGMSGAFCPIAI